MRFLYVCVCEAEMGCSKEKVLDFCYTSKSKLFKTLNRFTHGLGP